MRTVLVVEDDPDLREAVASLLRLEGFEPVCAADGQAALEYVRRSPPPSLVLLDLTLPKVDGVRVCQVLKDDSRLSAVPVVIVSSRTDTALAARRLDVAYLTKPFDVRALVHAVRRYAARR